MGPIHFLYSTPLEINEDTTRQWIYLVCKQESADIQEVSLHFLNSSTLREINKVHLSHDYETDVITFDHSFGTGLCADIMISPEDVKENADNLGVSFKDELDRVMIHGILHLLGYDDKNESDREVMREKEDHYLNLRPH